MLRRFYRLCAPCNFQANRHTKNLEAQCIFVVFFTDSNLKLKPFHWHPTMSPKLPPPSSQHFETALNCTGTKLCVHIRTVYHRIEYYPGCRFIKKKTTFFLPLFSVWTAIQYLASFAILLRNRCDLCGLNQIGAYMSSSYHRSRRLPLIWLVQLL